MSNNNKWEALSMKDRAFLIREAVRNGITDINSIRDTWEHRFDGESNQPTEDPGIWDTIKGWFDEKESIEQKPTTEGPVDLDELKIRQSWAESRFKDNAVSPAGATGRFQVMPNVKADYIKAGGRNGNLKDPKYNEEVRDWQMRQLAKRPWVDKEGSTDSVKVGKQLAAYNYGPTNLVNSLNKAKADGIDIYKSFDWIDEAYLPKETVDYVNWTLRNKPTGVHRNDTVYNLNKHKYSGKENSTISAIHKPLVITDAKEYQIPTFFFQAPNVTEKHDSPSSASSKAIYQERPVHILSDDATADFRAKVTRAFPSESNDHNFDICIGPGEFNKCAKYVSDYAKNASGLDPEETGIYGNAWTMLGNISKHGGIPVFNIYTDPAFTGIKNYKKLISETNKRKKDLESEYSKLEPGDIVGIFNPSSSYHKTTLKEGTTFNSHIGIVSSLDKNGVPIISHTVNEKDRKDPITALTGSAWGTPFVTVAMRPNYINPITELKFDDTITSDYDVPFSPKEDSQHEKQAYTDMQTYMDSLAQSKAVFRNLYPDVDWDNLEKAAIGILKRETNYMKTKQSDIVEGDVGEWDDRLATFARRAYHVWNHTPEENRSRDLTKFKFNTLPLSFRKAIGLNSPTQLDKDPKVTARAVLLQLGRIYDYYNRLFSMYPELEGTEEDKLNIAILSYNEGGKYHMGFDPKTGELKPEELNNLRRISQDGYVTKDISSTNYKYLNRIIPGMGDRAYDKWGEYRPGYIAAARAQMKKLQKKQK